MRTAVAIAALTLMLTCAAEAAGTKYWIHFTGKEQPLLAKSASLQQVTAVTGLTERALERRAKVSASSVSAEDLPVSPAYLRALTERGITIQNTSRWLNAATAVLTDAQVLDVQRLPFVRSVDPVTIFTRKEVDQIAAPVSTLTKSSAVNRYAYGGSETQMNLMNAIAVHNIGISGRGVLVGVLDTGFRWKTHDALKDRTVIAEYDFIQKDSSTANGVGDSGSQDSHGTSCMSLIGGYKSGSLVSSAFNARFILGKTEYVPSETNAEEDNWVAAIEWMESMGVDVVSSSLGYKEFDAGQRSYVYADMNGRTSPISIAATIAARKGVVVVNAMGNEGSGLVPPSITMPADADSIISVGAVSSSGVVASFSSNGPTSDGRTKPDVSNQGISTYAALPGGTITGSFGGTSAATPLTAGAVAMLLSARPELTPIQVRDALRNTASHANAPDNITGWGIVNTYNALLYHGMVIGTDPVVTANGGTTITVDVYVVSKKVIAKDSVKAYYTVTNGASFIPLAMTLTETLDAGTNSGKYSVNIPASGPVPKFYIRAVDADNKPRTSPYAAPSELYIGTPSATTVRPPESAPLSLQLHQNYPNPFNPATTIAYDVPVTGMVTLKVYDMLGREVRTLVNALQTPQSYTVRFDASSLPSGAYLCRLQMNGAAQTRRMMLVK